MSATMKKIPTNEITRNPLNPRMEFEPTTMEALKKSIEKVGILVPLTVYQGASDRKYYLVDGERRWRCATELGLREVPAVIIPEPDEKTILLQMFSIHHLRVQWKLIWTALKLETLMLMMKTEDDEELSSYTGMGKRKIDHCKRILYFPKKYQEILLLPERDERIKSDFFVELYPVLRKMRNEIPVVFERFSEEQVIDSLMLKFRRSRIHAAREFRILKEALESVKKKAISKDRVIELFDKLVSDPEMDIKQVSSILMLESPKTRDLTQACESVAKSLSEMSSGQLSEEKELQKAILKLKRQIDRLTSVGNRA